MPIYIAVPGLGHAHASLNANTDWSSRIP